MKPSPAVNVFRCVTAITAIGLWGLATPLVIIAQAPAQGIRVHGHWVIEVRNADGTLAGRREFENALFPTGKATLASLLTAQKTFDFWQVQINASGGELCPNNTICVITEPISPNSGPNWFKNLTKTVVNSTLVLRGSFVAAVDGAVSMVGTYTQTISPEAGVGFSQTTLQSPIPVQATQTVSVTVTFSFS